MYTKDDVLGSGLYKIGDETLTYVGSAGSTLLPIDLRAQAIGTDTPSTEIASIGAQGNLLKMKY